MFEKYKWFVYILKQTRKTDLSFSVVRKIAFKFLNIHIKLWVFSRNSGIGLHLFLPLGLGHLCTSLRASLHERLCSYSNVVLPPLLTPETMRQMGALAAVCVPGLK